MHRKWLIWFIVLLPVAGFGQLKYRTDTMYYEQAPVVMRRSSQGQIDSFQRLSPKAFQLGMNVQKLQKQLDAAKEAVLNKWELYDYPITVAQELIDKTLIYDSRFTMNVYQEELNVYKKYKQKQDAEEEGQK